MRWSGQVLSTGGSCMVPAEVRAIKEKASHLSSLTCEVGLTREVGSLAASLGVLQSSARPHSQRHTLGGSTYPSLRTSRGGACPSGVGPHRLRPCASAPSPGQGWDLQRQWEQDGVPRPLGLPKVPVGSWCRAEAGGLDVWKGPPRGPRLPRGTHVLTGPPPRGLS